MRRVFFLLTVGFTLACGGLDGFDDGASVGSDGADPVPSKTEPSKAEPVKAEPAKAEPAAAPKKKKKDCYTPWTRCNAVCTEADNACTGACGSVTDSCASGCTDVKRACEGACDRKKYACQG